MHSSSGHHVGFIRLSARQLVKNGTVPVSGTAHSSPGAQGAAATAKQAMAAYNNLYSRYFNVYLGLGLVLLILVASPSIASWLASGRAGNGWFLHDKKSEKFTEANFKQGFHRDLTMSVARPGRIQPVHKATAMSRYIYNQVLLPTVPLVNLTIGQLLVCAAYLALTLTFAFLRAGDQRVNWRRSGFIATAQVPTVFVLATKNSLVSVIGKGYEKINFLHRLAGRLVFIFSMVHAGLYLRVAGKLDLSGNTVATGFVSVLGLLLIFFTSVRFFRQRFYRIFLGSHILGWLAFVAGLAMHVDTARPYIYVALSPYLLDLVIRLVKTRCRSATLVALPGGMSMLQVHGLSSGWKAGQHVRVRVRMGMQWLESHPFTIASAPVSSSPVNGQRHLTLLCKSAGDWTGALNREAATPAMNKEKIAFGIGRTIAVDVEGPYGGAMFTDFGQAQAALLVAGGSGITFAAAVFEELVNRACESKSYNRSITLVWTMREASCIEWYQSMFSDLISTAASRNSLLRVQVQLYVTGPHHALHCPIPGAQLFNSRPDLAAIIATTVDDVEHETRGLVRGGGIAVAVCGAFSLVSQMRSEVGKVAMEKAVQVGGIKCHSETFGW